MLLQKKTVLNERGIKIFALRWIAKRKEKYAKRNQEMLHSLLV